MKMRIEGKQKENKYLEKQKEDGEEMRDGERGDKREEDKRGKMEVGREH